ncbi:hypothetical protein DL93DRAFT_2075917 [Clavulina sp. PMI_390]|nr:hypothetical protein DL93DRAFT_2075917 [Clavulina sp. PMI_390]
MCSIYWLGFFEPPRAKGWSLFYHQDYSYLIQDLVSLCMVLCVVGPQVMGPIGILILFAAHQIVPHSLDNGVDTACRVVSIIWFIYLGLMILKTLADRSEGYSELSVFEDVMGWVMLSWFPLVLIDGIKLGWGRGLDPDYWVDAWVLGWWKTMQQLIESGALSGV